MCKQVFVTPLRSSVSVKVAAIGRTPSLLRGFFIPSQTSNLSFSAVEESGISKDLVVKDRLIATEFWGVAKCERRARSIHHNMFF